jgi:hypothetical protein
VSTPQYEQVSSAADVEREAHRRTHVSLEAAQQKIAQLQSELQRSEGSFSSEAGARAELDLKQTKTERELESSRELATELREEIGRLRDNLERSKTELLLVQAEKTKLDQERTTGPLCGVPAAPEPALLPTSGAAEPEDAHATQTAEEDEGELPPPPLPDRGV